MMLTPNQILYVQGMGRLYRITAIFQDVDQANAYMMKVPGQGVIAVYEPLIFLANVGDRGKAIG